MNNLFYRNLLLDTHPIFRLPSTDLGKKNASIETLRGAAIILVVFGHMIGIEKTGGMKVSDDSIYRYLYYTLEYIRLPLFTVISGWVYANKPVSDFDTSKFLKGKFRRLIIPMLVIGTLLFLFRMFIPGTNSKPEVTDLPRILWLPYDVYWYLFSLFLIFVVISILDTRPFFQSFKGWATVLLCALTFLFVSENFLDPVPNIFSFKGAAYLFPFFLIGIGIHRFKNVLLHRKATLPVLLVFIASIIVQQIVWFENLTMQEKHSLLGMTVGISGILLLFRLQFKNNLLIWIGSYAYGIYLFHVFFTGGSRIILTRIGINHQATVLISGVLIAVIASILIEILISRSPLLRFYLLGLRKK